MRRNEAMKHLARVLKLKEKREAALLEHCGPAIPRTTLVFDQKTIAALRLVLEDKKQ